MSQRIAEPVLDATAEPSLRVKGEAILYRQYDVGYAIRLDRAIELLSSNAPERRRPSREGAQTIQIPHPPVTVTLETRTVKLVGQERDVEYSARIFDFGLVSIRARLVTPPNLPWDEFEIFGAAVTADPAWNERFSEVRRQLCERIAPAIEKPGEAPVTEEYLVFRVTALNDGAGRPVAVDALRDTHVAQLLLGELRPLSAKAREDLLSQRFSYFENDLTVLTWYAALVVDDEPGESDVEYVLEYANAQLLELRFYDAQLDAELPLLNARAQDARRGFHVLGRRFSRLLQELHARVVDATETQDRIENSFKVTDDVFLARIYVAALDIFGGRAWRHGIDRKLETLRGTYVMLNAEAQALRSEVLEVAIIVLILAEIVLATLKR